MRQWAIASKMSSWIFQIDLITTSYGGALQPNDVLRVGIFISTMCLCGEKTLSILNPRNLDRARAGWRTVNPNSFTSDRQLVNSYSFASDRQLES